MHSWHDCIRKSSGITVRSSYGVWTRDDWTRTFEPTHIKFWNREKTRNLFFYNISLYGIIKVGDLRMGCKDFNDQNAKVFPRVGLGPTSLPLASTALTDWATKYLCFDRVIALIGQYEWFTVSLINQSLSITLKPWKNKNKKVNKGPIH